MAKGPKPPDPYKTAAAQQGMNIDTAIAERTMDNTNQVTPYGNLSYTIAGYDKIGGKKVPRYVATQTLSPQEQNLQENQWALGDLWGDTALRQGQYASDVMSKPFDYSTGEHEKWAGDLYHKLSDPTNEANRAAMAQRLSGQGLQAGSTAYNDAMQNLLYSQDKAFNDFNLGSQQQGFQQAQAIRNQPLNEVAAMMGMSGVTQPNYVNTPQTQMAGTDLAGLIANNYNQQSGAYNAQMGALAGLGGAALGGWASGGFKNPMSMFK